MGRLKKRIGAFLLAFMLTVASVLCSVPTETYANNLVKTNATSEEWSAIEGNNYGHGVSGVDNAKPTVKDENGTVGIGLDYSANSEENSTAKIQKNFSEEQDISDKKYIGYSLTYPKELDGKIKSDIAGIYKEKKPEPPVVDKGMHVEGNKLYDADGNEFIFRGINIPHAWYKDYTKQTIDDVASLGANSVRVVLGSGSYTDRLDGKKHGYAKTPSSEVEQIINWCKNKNLICVLELHDFTGTDSEENITTRACGYWKELKTLLNENKDYVIVNIANEWQGTWKSGDLWGDTYANAVKILRDAGIENTLMVDASGWGQETDPIIKDCKKVLAADSTGNTMFSYHVYGSLGKNSETIENGLGGLKNKGVCMCVGEFAYWQQDQDVDERYLVDYCQKNGIGWLAWSWAGNSGKDVYLDLTSAETFSKDDLTEWGKFVFYGKNGIEATSKLAYKKGDYQGERHSGPLVVKNPDHVDPPKPPIVDDVDIKIEPGELKNYEWKLCKNADMNKSCDTEKLEALKNGGYRVDNVSMKSEDGENQPYPTLYISKSEGWDLSKHKTLDLVMRNTNSEPIQVNLILKTGESWSWQEPNKPKTFIDVAGRTTQLISFDISGTPDLNDVKQISFRLQSGTGTAEYPIDFCSMGFDLAKDAYKSDIIEMNRPKSIGYFTWSYPETSFKKNVKEELDGTNGTLTFTYADISAEDKKSGGIETETKPGLGEGMDFTPYKTISAKLKNDSSEEIHCSLVLRTGVNWDWSESAGVSKEECVLAPGESRTVSYNLKDSEWKNESTDWKLEGKLDDLDDVRGLAFKIYPSSGKQASGSFTISDFEFYTDTTKNLSANSAKLYTAQAETEDCTQAQEDEPLIAPANDSDYIEKEAFDKEAVFYNKHYDPYTKTYTAYVYAPLSDVEVKKYSSLVVGFTGVKTAFKGTVTMSNFHTFNELPEKKVQILPEDIQFAKKTFTLTEGEREDAKLTTTPENAETEGLKYTSSNSEVATIDETGMIQAVKPGTATITATWDDLKTESKVIVNKKIIPVTEVKLLPSQMTLNVGGKGTLTATVLPKDADNKNVTWSVADNTVATVEDGKVTALKAGKTKVTVTTEDGNFKAESEIIVKENVILPENIEVVPNQVTLKAGETKTLKATVTPDNATDKTVQWNVYGSEDIFDYKENEDGTITIVAKKVEETAGASIAAYTSNGKFTVCNIIVMEELKPPVVQTPDQPSKEPEPSVEPSKPSEPEKPRKPEVSLEANWGMNVGEEHTLISIVKNQGNNVIEWSSNHPDIAEVENGIVRAKKAGTAVITLKVGTETATCTITVNEKPEIVIPVASVKLNIPSIELDVNDSAILTPSIMPLNATNKNLVWASEQPKVAKVDGGAITAIAPGETKITVTTEDGGYTASCMVTVKKPDPKTKPVKQLQISQDKIVLKPGQKDSLAPVFVPADATNQKVTWSVTDDSVISVDSDGVVKALKAGYAWVKVTAQSGGCMAICRVDVVEKDEPVLDDTVNVSKVELTTDSSEMRIGDEIELAQYVKISPVNVTNAVISWESNYPDIASVDAQTGKVTANAVGKAGITVSVKTGDVVKSAVYNVTVLPKEEGDNPVGVEIPMKKLSVRGVKSALTLDYSKTSKVLDVEILPSNTTNKALKVKTENKKILKATVKGTKLKLTMVKPGATVVTISSKENSSIKKKIKVTIRPAKINGLKVSSVKKNSMKLSWKKAANVSGYKVYLETNGKWKCVKTIKSAKVNSFEAKKLKKKTTYQYKVTAIVKNGSKYIEGDTTKAAIISKSTKAK